jgi:hypothetical protein
MIAWKRKYYLEMSFILRFTKHLRLRPKNQLLQVDLFNQQLLLLDEGHCMRGQVCKSVS